MDRFILFQISVEITSKDIYVPGILAEKSSSLLWDGGYFEIRVTEDIQNKIVHQSNSHMNT